MSSALHSALKAHTFFRCKQKLTSKNQANIHQRYCTSLVKSDGMGREFLESFSTTFTQSALAKDLQQGNRLVGHIGVSFFNILHFHAKA
jgi:hypothetical protein